MKLNTKILNIIIKIFFIIMSFALAIPSIFYLFEHKTILNFGPYFYFLYNTSINRIHQTVLYLIILFVIIILYFLIIKRRNTIFNTTKKMFIFIAIIAFIFALILPFTSSDIFYYMGIGRLEAKYNQNPYYTTMRDFVDTADNYKFLEQDTMLKAGYDNYWSDTTVVYGPVWTMICKLIGIVSFGNLDIGIVVFKLINILVHLINCYFIYKISNKRIFTLLYGLNPFVLIEGISCAHNDIYVVLFILVSLYMLLKKKNLAVSVIFLAIATTIKYFAVLLLPFIIIYYYREEKPLKRLLRCLEYGGLFVLALIIPYLFYMQDFQVLSGLAVQQNKIAKNFYVIIYEFLKEPEVSYTVVNSIFLKIFMIVYFFSCVILLNKKEIKFREEMRKANYYIMVFLFIIITNFQPWYVIWIFPLFMWQKADGIIWIPQIAIICELANSIFLAFGEWIGIGIPFTYIFVIGSLSTFIINQKIREKKRVKKFICKNS